MNERDNAVDRSLLVFAVWAAIGSIGLLLIIEGFQQDVYWIALTGIGCIISTFCAHIIVNAVYGTGFSTGETALGLTSFGVLVLVFVLSVLAGGASATDFYIGLTLFGTLIVGFLTYLLTRHGLRGAFSKFHVSVGHDVSVPNGKG
jgi:hypothetical protein